MTALPLLALLSVAACTTRTEIEYLPADNPGPPPDERPLDAGPDVPHVEGPTILAEGLSDPRGLLLLGGDVYVAEHGAGRVVRVPATGGDVAEVASGLEGPFGIATDGVDLYVTERAAGRVVRVTASGEVSTLAADQATPGRVRYLDDFVYWVAEGAGNGGAWAGGALRRAPRAGGAVEDLAVDLVKPRGLALTSGGAIVTTVPSNSVLLLVPHTGGAATTLSQIVGEEAFDCAADEGTGHVFWNGRTPGWPGTGWIYRTTLAPGGSNQRVAHSSPNVNLVAVDDAHVYWSHVDAIQRTERAGSALIETVAAKHAVGAMAIDGARLYFTNHQTGRVHATDLP